MLTVTAPTDLPDDPYAVVLFRGKRVRACDADLLLEAEERLGYQLTVVQGMPAPGAEGATASAGTHDDGRVWDLTAWDHRRKVRVLRDLGAAVWWRPTLPGVWAEHIHGLTILDSVDNAEHIAPAGFRQIGSYLRRRDGLARDLPDPTYRPVPPVVRRYRPTRRPAAMPVTNNVTEARDQLVEAAHALGVAAVKLESTSKRRTVVRAQVATIRGIRRGINGVLRILPKS